MDHEITPIDEIDRRAHAAAAESLSLTACPFPDGTDASTRWRCAYREHAINQQQGGA
jgi:hypothetical protein